MSNQIFRIRTVAKAAALALCVSGSMASLPVKAASLDSNLNLSAQVVGTCTWTLGTLNSIAFQDVSFVNSMPAGNSVSFTAKCTAGMTTTPTLTISMGANEDQGVRRMRKGASSEYLPYKLFAGSTELTANGVDYTGNGSNQQFEVWAQLTQAVASTQTPGNYSDATTITLTYTP